MSLVRRLLPLLSSALALAVVLGLAPAHAQTFSNPNQILIPSANATPRQAGTYPAQIVVSGVFGAVADLNVSLNGFAHTYPGDVDILLVGPQGQKVVLMSDAGGANQVTGLSLSFDDEAAGPVAQNDPPRGAISGGSYRPTDYTYDTDTYSSPAPAAPYGLSLSTFDGVSPNGTWSLYIMDDAAVADGRITGGYSLNFSISDPTGAAGLVVTTLADTVAADGLVSLREAITSANNDGVNSAITFSEAVFAGPRKAITLNGTQLPTIVNGSTLSIAAPSAGVEISGNNLSRVFLVGRADVTFAGLTITNGNAGTDASTSFGGGIYNIGTLTLDSCTVSGSSALQGGGIYSNTFTDARTLTIRNSTLSGNTAGEMGGGLFNALGLTRIESSTITGNTAPDGGGGGVASSGSNGTAVRTEVSNSIIAGNRDSDGGSDVDFVGGATNSFQSNGFNLVGDGNATGDFNATSDLTGSLLPGLAPLADNGGPTPTHALLPGSPARESGSTTLTLDQRGVERPQPFGGQDDRGAFENNVFSESLVVTTFADEDNNTSDPSFGTGTSLREAINFSNIDGVDSAITFSNSVFAAPRKTITLRGEQFSTVVGNGTLSITAPPAGVVISGNSQSGVFEFQSDSFVTLTGLTITGGNTDAGGGIRNFATLLVDSCTLTGNGAGYGGAIYSENNGTGGSLTVRNSTLSGNQAGEGGAIYTSVGSTRIESSTITGNSAPTNFGAGIVCPGDMFTPVSVVVQNSIIAGNVGTDVDYVFGNQNSDNITSEGYNLIGDGNGTDFFFEPGDVTGNSDPKLGPLAENGGPTRTHALLVGSPALDAGQTNLTVDQRGITRPQGSTDDIGAFEVAQTPPSALSINDVTKVEANSGTANIVFTLSLSAPSTQNITVNFATVDGTASAGSDYNARSGTVTIPANQTTATITVPVIGDLLDEANETFRVNLSAPTNATITDNQAIGTITDDDLAPVASINSLSIIEGNTGSKNATFTITLSAVSGQTASVNAIPSNGSARSPGDFTASGAKLTFAPGETTKIFNVPILGDLLDEPNETFYVVLASPANCAIGTGRGIGTITDDDAAPTISIDDISVKEYNAGQTTAAVRLKLSAVSGQVVKVSYATANGTANPATGGTTTGGTTGSDYVTVAPTQVAFNAGGLYAYARVLINGDTLPEANETFLVNLTNPLNATIADAQGVGTILNDDAAPSLTINDVSVVEGNSGTKLLTFTVTLSKASGQTVRVNYASADGIARSTSDYVAKSGTLSFTPGSALTRTISMVINGDTVFEGNETFYVLLSGAINASVSKARGTGTITNDDTSA